MSRKEAVGLSNKKYRCEGPSPRPRISVPPSCQSTSPGVSRPKPSGRRCHGCGCQCTCRSISIYTNPKETAMAEGAKEVGEVSEAVEVSEEEAEDEEATKLATTVVVSSAVTWVTGSLNVRRTPKRKTPNLLQTMTILQTDIVRRRRWRREEFGRVRRDLCLQLQNREVIHTNK
ncbi:hypothetical protein NQZ68_037235 [Dissostichus eleginoides]|nr:hypothetical protein NQZ68_037235 [Dissostichus eleginoides]